MADATVTEQVSRGGKPVELRPDLELAAGDHVLVVGLRDNLVHVGERIGEELGGDDATLDIDIVAGFLLGGLVWQVADIPLTLGTGGGCLLTGLLFGWVRSKRPTFGQYDPGTADVIKRSSTPSPTWRCRCSVPSWWPWPTPWVADGIRREPVLCGAHPPATPKCDIYHDLSSL